MSDIAHAYLLDIFLSFQYLPRFPKFSVSLDKETFFIFFCIFFRQISSDSSIFQRLSILPQPEMRLCIRLYLSFSGLHHPRPLCKFIKPAAPFCLSGYTLLRQLKEIQGLFLCFLFLYRC